MRLDFKSPHRGYTVDLSCDLFGAYILRRHWFGLSNKRGGMKQQVFVTEQEALQVVKKIVQARTRNGYQQIPNYIQSAAFSMAAFKQPEPLPTRHVHVAANSDEARPILVFGHVARRAEQTVKQRGAFSTLCELQ